MCSKCSSAKYASLSSRKFTGISLAADAGYRSSGLLPILGIGFAPALEGALKRLGFWLGLHEPMPIIVAMQRPRLCSWRSSANQEHSMSDQPDDFRQTDGRF